MCVCMDEGNDRQGKSEGSGSGHHGWSQWLEGYEEVGRGILLLAAHVFVQYFAPDQYELILGAFDIILSMIIKSGRRSRDIRDISP